MKNLSFNKGRPSCLCIFIYAILLSNNMYAIELTFGSYTKQLQHQIIGTVTDAAGPLPSVTVIVKGTITSAVTDEKGHFSITANSTDVLVFSFIGYATQEINVGNQTSIMIILSEDSTQLKEVTINAGYYKVKDKERTGSIARITSKDIETQPVSNILASMQGRMAGVNIVQNTGLPGGGFDIEIRGRNSLRADGNAPLYVIDGVPYSSDATGSPFTATGFPSGTSPLNSISPEAVESIEILKDADATAIYGSRGANGVVLITTKKGKIGKTQFIFNASTGVATVARFMDLMSTQEYIRARENAFANDGITTYPDTAYDVNGTWDRNRYTDWQKEITGGHAEISEIQGSISGGSANTQFLVGGNYHSQGTVFPGRFNYKKGGVNLNLSHQSEDNRFKVVVSANYVVQDNRQPGFDPTVDAKATVPNAPALYDSDGNLNWENNTWTNPLANLNGVFKSATNDLVANTTVSYNLLPSLRIKSSFGYTDTRQADTRTSPSTIYNPAFGLTSQYSGLFVNSTVRKSWIVEPQVSYEKMLGKGKFEVLVGTTFQQQNTNRLTEFGFGFTSNSLIYDLASATSRTVAQSNEIEYRYQALFGRINYNWDSKYIINLTGRRDGSSRFGPENRYANFGAVGAAWVFSEEALLKDSKVLSFGKLRASYGTTGSDNIGDYQFLDTYASSGVLYQNVVGLQPTRLFNPNFGWETNRKLEGALELGFFEDRIFLTSAIFRNRSSNQLVGIPLPATTGFSSLQANLGATVQNMGYEFTLHTVNMKTTNFSWTTNINLSLTRNKLLEFPGLENSTYSQQYRIGKPLNILMLYHYTGIDPETGIYQFEDVNNDGKITFPDDRQMVADLTPKYYGGFQNRIEFKRFTLDFLFQFVKQKNQAFLSGNAGLMFNHPTGEGNAWQNPGDDAPFQILTTGVNGEAMTAQELFSSSSGNIVDASYVRLKNVSLSYDLPLPYTETTCRLSLQAQNLLTFTKYNGDPEFAAMGYLTPLRIISAGVQLTF